MTYSSITDFKDKILEYLNADKKYHEEDIKDHEQLSDAQKVEDGFLVECASVLSSSADLFYSLSVSENNTKLRPGDKIKLINGKKAIDAKVIENTEAIISVESSEPLSNGKTYSLVVREFVLLDPIIKLAEQIEDGAPGSYWIEILALLKSPVYGSKPIPQSAISSSKLNPQQIDCCKNVLRRPSVYCLQGPPGTGKTDVLATLANAYSSNGHEVLIISNTHQAVNNALNKIRTSYSNNTIVKIGESLKGEGLVNGIIKANTYSSYISSRKKDKRKNREKSHDIVGMTFQAAVINLGLRSSDFYPSLILVDEAGQMPLAQGALIGLFGAQTIVLIGDDLQMPPIYHEKLANDPLSQSIFTYLCKLYPNFKTVLTTTYRMNTEITDAVSKNYYQPNGITLDASVFSANRKLILNVNSGDQRIDSILNSDKAIHQIDVSTNDNWEDYNDEEAEFIANIIKAAIVGGLAPNDMAVITPYRRQVKAIREHVRKKLGSNSAIPLIDTVERLQGQDVDMIIISESATKPAYWVDQESFILNSNRLNVMLSRAKKKVIIVGKRKIIP